MKSAGAMTRNRRRTWVAALSIVMVAGAACVFLTSGPPEADTTTAAATEPDEALTTAYRAAARTPQAANIAPPAVEEAADVGVEIEGIDLDKQEACKGVEITVNVRARSPERDGGRFLSYGVLGRPDVVGPRFTLRLEESLAVDWMRVFVRGQRGAAIKAVPPVVVRDCETPDVLTIDVQRRTEMMDRAWLTARLAERGAAAEANPLRPVEYRWTFADGTTQTTTTPEVEHSFENRRQNASYAYFFVTVEARDAGGRTARGSRSLRFVNLGFHPLVHDRQVVLFSAIDPAAAGGEKVWLYHGHDEAVRIDRVVVNDVVRGPNGGDLTVGTDGRDATSLLGFAEIPPGKSLAASDLAALRPTDRAKQRVVELTGHTASGLTARGAFNLLASDVALAASGNATEPTSEESQP
jgi:hypothetical protein